MNIRVEAKAQAEAAKSAVVLQSQKQMQGMAEQQLQQAVRQHQQELSRSQAISQFRALNPEGLLQKLRGEVWNCGQVIHPSDDDPTYNQLFGGRSGLDRVILYNIQDISSHTSRKGYHVGQGPTIDPPSSGYEGRGSYTEDTYYYPADFAYIYLYESPEYKPVYNIRYKVEAGDYTGHYAVRKTRYGLFGLGGSEEFTYYGMSRIEGTYFDLSVVKPQAILSFFVSSTVRRMQGEGNLRIS